MFLSVQLVERILAWAECDNFLVISKYGILFSIFMLSYNTLSIEPTISTKS